MSLSFATFLPFFVSSIRNWSDVTRCDPVFCHLLTFFFVSSSAIGPLWPWPWHQCHPPSPPWLSRKRGELGIIAFFLERKICKEYHTLHWKTNLHHKLEWKDHSRLNNIIKNESEWSDLGNIHFMPIPLKKRQIVLQKTQIFYIGHFEERDDCRQQWCNKCATISVQLSGPKKVALADSPSKLLPKSLGFLNTAAWNALLRDERIDLGSHDVSKICLQFLPFK